jgi:DNA-binding transcriptional ArsR family regulator
METRRDVFQAIADPTRRAIIALLAAGSLTPNAIAENFDSSRQAVSKHIQILVECELVEQQQHGREIYYHFNPKKMKEVADWLAPFQKLWEGRFSRLDDVLKKLKSKKDGK